MNRRMYYDDKKFEDNIPSVQQPHRVPNCIARTSNCFACHLCLCEQMLKSKR